MTKLLFHFIIIMQSADLDKRTKSLRRQPVEIKKGVAAAFILSCTLISLELNLMTKSFFFFCIT